MAFDNFDAEKMSNYRENEIEILMQNPTIIRHRGKIEAAINNARQFLRLQREYGSFNHFIWQFTQYDTIVISIKTWSDVRATIPQSDAMSKALKKEGFKFVGSTTCMAYMEAVGMVSDHFSDCWRS
mgnify:FL=1